MADASQTCPACGARVSTGLDRCDMCGTPISSSENGSEPDSDASEELTPNFETESTGAERDSAGATSDPPGSVYCNQCGHENPGEANYCSRCGTELEELSAGSVGGETRSVEADLPKGPEDSGSDDDANPVQGSDDQAAMGKQVVWMVGVGILIVLGFFFVTQWSQQYEWGGTSSTAESTSDGAGGSAQASQGQATPRSSSGASGGASTTSLQALVNELSSPVQGSVSGKVDSLRREVENATGSEKQEAQEALVRMYIGAGTPGRAAVVQRDVADATGSVDDQRRAANLLYRWMRQVEQQGDRAKVSDVAQHVATAYEVVVNSRPNDLDARTRMGEAYQLTNNPMKGIQAINAVLEDDSTFVPALFQKGLALLKINRLEDAISQFQAVKTYSDPQEPFYKQADRAIEVIREQTSSSNGGGQSGG